MRESDKTIVLKPEALEAAEAKGKELAALPVEEIEKTVVLKPEELKEPAKRKAGPDAKSGTEQMTAMDLLRNTGVFTRKRDVDEEISQTAINLLDNSKEIHLEPERKVKATIEGAHLEERYEKLDQFAEGGHGTVSIAQDKELKRLVALKSLKPAYIDDDSIVSSFVSEARLTAQLEHPAVVPIYSMERDKENGIHLAMKLIRGRTLKEYLSQIVQSYNRDGITKFDEGKSLAFRLDIFLRVCDALAYAHNRNVMHCDLKPENILIGEYREAYLMDWGIARLVKEPDFDPTKWVKPKSISGTPRYLSPEAINGEHTDERADIYSMGLILFELTTLSNAVTGSDPMEVMNRIRYNELEPLRHRFGYPIDQDLKAIVRKATETDKAKRYQAVQELAEDIRRYIRFAEVSANPDNAIMKCVRWLHNHRMAFILSTITVLFIGATGASFALYERMNAIEVTRERENVINAIHSNTVAASFSIDRLALHLENLLSATATEAAFLMRWGGKTDVGHCYYYKDFQDDKTAPADFSYSPVYRMKISPGHFVYKGPPGMSGEELRQNLEKLVPIGRKLEYVVLDSIPGGAFDPKNLRKAEESLLVEGRPMRWISVGMDNGFFMSYPGKGTYPSSFDPRLRPWYKEGSQCTKATWASPYIDAGGQGIVIPCTAPILDENGKVLGVVGMDVAFDYIVDRLKNAGNRAPFVIDKYLVNKDGKIVVSTNSKYAGLSYQPGTIVNDVPELPLFPDSQLLKKMWAAKFGSILERGLNSETLYSFATINTLSLLYIEQLNFNLLMEDTAAKKKTGVAQ